MTYQVEAVCPCCSVVAGGDLNKIEEVFGFRTVEGERLIRNRIVVDVVV